MLTPQRFRLHLTLLFATLLLFSCLKSVKKRPQQRKRIDVWVINDNLESLLSGINKNYLHLQDSSNLYVDDRLRILNAAQIESFIQLGARKELRDLNSASYTHFPSYRLTNVDKVNVLATYPASPKEFKENLGSMYFSRIVYNEDSTFAMYIYDFSRFGKYPPRSIGYVETRLIKNHWKITRRIYAN